MAAHPQYAPQYKIKINGENIPPSLRASILSVRYDNGATEMDRVEIKLADPGLHWLEHPLLNVNNEIALSFGYAGFPLQEVFLGEITGRQASFSGGATSMTVEASDFSYRLMAGQKEKSFGFLPDPAIILSVAMEKGMIPISDTNVSTALSALSMLLGKPLFQQNQSDYELLQKLAAQSGVQLTMEGRSLFFKFFQDMIPLLTLKWGRNLIDFSPRLSIVGQVEGVSVKIWLREIKLSLVVTISYDFELNRLSISVIPAKAESLEPSYAKFKVLDHPIKDPTDNKKALSKAFSELKHKLNNKVTGSGSAVGDASIRAGILMGMEGLGTGFSGNYRVKSTTHTMDSSGYKTSFNLYRELVPEVFS